MIIQMSLFVAFQPREVLCRVPAIFADEWLLIEMDSSMSHHMMFELECFVAEVAGERSHI